MNPSPSLFLTGFADEAANDIAGQIRATHALGWDRLEARNVDGQNLNDLSEADFDRTAGALEASGVRVNCLGSTIANWAKSIHAPFDETLQEIARAIPRMQRLRIPQVRIMSYAILRDRSPEQQEEGERVRRIREVRRRFADAGLEALHENCANYGGMGPAFTRRLLEGVPGLRLVFDTGNPVTTENYELPEPRPRQSAWMFYREVRPAIAHVHIKDGIFVRERREKIFDDARYTWPGEGHGDVLRILIDLLETGYRGGLSIEPHLAQVFHDADGKVSDQVRFDTYVGYGRRFEALVDEARARGKKLA